MYVYSAIRNKLTTKIVLNSFVFFLYQTRALSLRTIIFVNVSLNAILFLAMLINHQNHHRTRTIFSIVNHGPKILFFSISFITFPHFARYFHPFFFFFFLFCWYTSSHPVTHNYSFSFSSSFYFLFDNTPLSPVYFLFFKKQHNPFWIH